ncbi:uncharacterized protein LOC135160266 isoform X2 [Diachasmimorpha longicaudata]|uniref:uncharacterized protein LOC135160266 isoform X2 n=1 Tax=Diachasmimorpha longicaudata TaxID=58733 RepID=UPI0030B8CE66
MSRIYGSSSSDEDEDRNRWRKHTFFKGNKTSGRAGPSDRKKRTQKHQDPALPDHLDTCNYYRNEELLQLGTFLGEDDPLVSCHKRKKNRSEPREVATADDPVEAKRTTTYLLIDISDDEDANFNSVKTEFYYHDFKQNGGENDGALDEMTDDMTEQSISYPPSPSLSQEVKNVFELSKPVQNVENTDVLNEVLGEVMQQCVFYPLRTSTNEEIDPLLLENDSQLSGSRSYIKEERVLDQVMNEVMKQPTPYSSGTSMKPEISESSESEYRMNNRTVLDPSTDEFMGRSLSELSSISHHREIDPLGSESESQSLKPEQAIKNDNTSALQTPSVPPISRLSDHREIDLLSPKTEAESQESKDPENYTTLELIMDDVMNQASIKNEEITSENLRQRDRSPGSSDYTESPPSRRSPHRVLNDTQSSSDLDRLIDRALECRLSSVSSDYSESTASRTRHDQVTNDTPLSSSLDRCIDDTLESQLSSIASNYSKPVSSRRRYRAVSGTQSSHLDRLIDRALECRLSSVSSDYSESTASRTRHDQVTNDTPLSSSLDRCIDDTLESQLSSIASNYSKPVSSRRRYRAVSGTQSSHLDRLIDRALEGRLSSISPNQSKVLSPRRSRHRIENDPESPPDNRRINRVCENRSASIVPADSNQCFVHDQNALDFIRERPLESDDDEDDDEFTPSARPESIVQANAHDSSVIPNRENNETTCHRRRDPQNKYYPRKHFSPNENKAMIDILISDDQIHRATTLSYWQSIALLQLEALKGRSAKSLFNHFMRFLLPKRYAGYVKDPFALAQFDAMYEEWVHRSRI